MRWLVGLLCLMLYGCSRSESDGRVGGPSPVPATPATAEATPASPKEQRARCLAYTAERETFGESRRVKIRVRNSCEITIPVEETEFEITAMPSDGLGLVSSATARFPTAIGPLSSNVETTVELDCPGDVHAGCKYFVEPR